MSPRRVRLYAVLLAALHLLLAGSYSVFNPAGEAPDEADHWAFVVYLAQEGQLPVGPRVTQSKHPPLYHGTAALVALPAGPRFDFLRANPDVHIEPTAYGSPNFFVHTRLEAWPWRESVLAFHLARFWSVLLSTATVLAIYGLAATVWPGQPLLALAATAMAACLPEFNFIGGSVNNDNAAALFGTLALWGGLALFRSGGRWGWRSGWWTPLALGLGLLAKVSTSGLWPAVALAVVAGAAVGPSPTSTSGLARVATLWKAWRRWLGSLVAVFVPAVALASPWFIRNWRLYGDPLGMALVRQTVDERATPWGWSDTGWLLKGWFVSFWGKFGGAGHMPMAGWIYGLLAFLTLVSLLGLARRLWRGGPDQERIVLGLLLVAAGGVALGIWRYSLVALGTDQGRLLFPALGALAVLWVAGLDAWLPDRGRGVLAWALVVGLSLLSVYGLVGVIRTGMAPPAPVPPASVPAAGQPIRFGELSLVHWELTDPIRLYWRSEEPPTQDWRTVVRVVAEDGSLVWEWRRSPGYGRWSTDWWPEGVVIQDVYQISWPTWAGPGRYRVEVGLQPFGGDFAVPSRAGEELDREPVLLGWLERP